MPANNEVAQREKSRWLDVLGLVFLAGLAVLPPFTEVHKYFILLAIGVFQVFIEGRLIVWLPKRGRNYSVLIKILLATLLLGHTGEAGINSAGINSEYWPIYFLPVMTAAIYFGPVATLGWTALASLAYCSYLIPARIEFEITPESYELLGIRILFFFLAAILVNRFASENRRQVARYQSLSETLADSNRQLQRAQAEARRAERLAALGQLSAGLAHEIRNPLGIIKGAAEMLNQKFGASQPAAAELSTYISTEVNRLNGLVSRFLDFARPSRLELKPVDIRQVVDRALEIAHHRYPELHVSIERQIATGLPPVLADEQMCEQVFVNLILNAHEAMSPENDPKNAERNSAPSTPKITIAISRDSTNGLPGVAVEIQDSGPGVPDELREQIFNPFVSSKKTGVGLGLSIVAKIVDDHGGSIQLISRAGMGACFRVFLPAAAA
ncbi:MAG: ATP-binding protein [Candidatus Acidiferrales bacterium]